MQRLRTDGAFISDRCVEHGTIEELVEQLQHLEFTKHFGRAVEHAFVSQKFPEIFFGQNDGPDQLADGDVLLSAARADFEITFFDIKFTLAEKPVAEMAIDLIDALLQ